MKYEKKINNRSILLLLLFLFSTSLLSIKTLKKVNIQDIRISGSELFSQNDVVKNTSLKFPIRLILINAHFLEKSSNKILLNEINTIPGFTKNSMFPMLWKASGLNIEQLVAKLVDITLDL